MWTTETCVIMSVKERQVFTTLVSFFGKLAISQEILWKKSSSIISRGHDPTTGWALIIPCRVSYRLWQSLKSGCITRSFTDYLLSNHKHFQTRLEYQSMAHNMLLRSCQRPPCLTFHFLCHVQAPHILCISLSFAPMDFQQLLHLSAFQLLHQALLLLPPSCLHDFSPRWYCNSQIQIGLLQRGLKLTTHCTKEHLKSLTASFSLRKTPHCWMWDIADVGGLQTIYQLFTFGPSFLF